MEDKHYLQIARVNLAGTGYIWKKIENFDAQESFLIVVSSIDTFIAV